MPPQNNEIEFDLTKKELLHDYVLVRAVRPKRHVSVIIDPMQYNDKPEIGIVLSTGKDAMVSDGDIVMFNKYSNTKFTNPATSEDLFIVRNDDIICR